MGDILESVRGAMGKYGYDILNVLITDVKPERSVTRDETRAPNEGALQLKSLQPRGNDQVTMGARHPCSEQFGAPLSRTCAVFLRPSFV